MVNRIRNFNLKRACLFISFCCLPFTLFAWQDSLLIKNKTNIQRPILKSNPLPILWGPITVPADSGPGFPITSEYRLMYEVPVAPNQAIMVGVSFLGKNVFLKLFGLDTSQFAKTLRNISINGFRIQGMYKYYITNKWRAPRGIYIGPHVSYSYAILAPKQNANYYLKFENTNFNILMGAQCLLWDRIAIDVFSGLGYKNNVMETHLPGKKTIVEPVSSFLPHTKFTIGMNLGLAF